MRPVWLIVPFLVVATAATRIDAQGEGGDIDWEDCKGADTGGQCAKVKVPLDYDHPGGDTIEISVTRAPAKGDRIGALFVNPGGPGSTAGDIVEELANLLPDPINRRFDVVGVDPRGTGASKLDCGFDMAKLFGADPYVRTDDERDALVKVNERYVKACNKQEGDKLAHMGTRDAARDIDFVREVLGDDQISYLGLSYGTVLGQVYAQEFPDRVRAMALDGSVPIGPTGLESAESQAVGFETALKAFAAECDPRPDCPIGPDAMGAVEGLLAQTQQEPVPAKPRKLGPGEMATGLSLPLYSQDMWPDLAKAVSAGLKGRGSAMVKLADTYLGEVDFDLYYAVNCIDFEWPDDPDEMIEAAKAAATTSPHFGDPEVNEYLECSMWPVDADPLKPVTQPISPQVLVVATTDDPATPYAEGQRTARTLGGVLLTHKGEGHTSVGDGDACIDNAVTSYLVDLKLPAAGTTC